jgi:hypothetical protein
MFRGSADYWERRYAAEGSSGPGSYGPTATFKAEVLNAFVAEHSVLSVIEFGSGDGHQLSLAEYPAYIGLDVSSTAVKRCRSLFEGDATKSFIAYDPTAFVNNGALRADMAISLDVILHLVEDEVYDTYMRELFRAAERFVAIFSMNEERTRGLAPHVRWRRFTDWVDRNAPEWRMLRRIENPGKGADSAADFYLFERTR